MDDEEAENAMKEVVDICEPDMRDERGEWTVMYVRLRFLASAPM